MQVIIEPLDNYSVEVLDQMKSAFIEYIENGIGKDLNLELLDCIYIPDDFGKAIIDFQIEHNHDERGHTQNEQGEAVGKVIGRFEDGREIKRVFINKGIFLGLFGDDEDFKLTAFNVVHHELCHVHDDYYFASMVEFNTQLKSEKASLNKVLIEHSLDVWGEYKVPKMCANTKKTDFEFFIKDISDSVEYVRSTMKKAIEDYPEKSDLLTVFHQVQLLGGFLLKKMSTLYGDIKGKFGDNHPEIIKSFDKLFDAYGFDEQWGKLKVSLDNLDLEYPNWTDLNVLNELKDVVMSCWIELGVYPKDTDKGLYIRLLNT